MKKNAIAWVVRSMYSVRGRVALLIVSALVFGAAEMIFPLMFRSIIDNAAQGRFNPYYIMLFCALALFIALPVAHMQRGFLCNFYAYTLRGDVFQHLLRMDMAFHDNRGSTIVLSQATQGVGASVEFMEVLTETQVLISVPVALFSAYYIGMHSMTAVGLIGIIFVGFILASHKLGQRVSLAESQYYDIDNVLMHRQREMIQRVDVVKTSGATTAEVSRYWTDGAEALRIRNKLVRLYSTFRFLGRGAHSLVYLIVLGIFLPQVVQGTLTMGTFFALLLYASRAVEPAIFLGEQYSKLKRIGAKIEPLVDMLHERTSITEGSLQLRPVRSAIIVEHVTFSYPGASQPTLRDVCVRIPAGKKTAIVGHTGAGKSTLARVILRLYDPQEGVVCYDGTDVRHMSFSSLREEVSYLPQEVPIFTGTISDNVCFGDGQQYHDGVMLRALERAAAGFVGLHEDGVLAKVGEMGKKLSGGERQRIALARIFMRNPSVIILDESTSALDNITEAKVSESLTHFAQGDQQKTLIIIAHRLSTIQSADQIIMMEHGRVIDTGSHEELMDRCDAYAALNSTLIV